MEFNEGSFSGDWIFGDDGSLLLLADNYILTITNITTEAQSAQRTNERRRLLLARGRRPWAGPSGLAALLSGRAGLRSGEDGSRWAAFSRPYFLGNDGNWQFLLAFLIMDLKHVIYIFL